MNSGNIFLKYSKTTEGKFLFVRHGQTFYNADSVDPFHRINPIHVDARLTEKGIEQAKSLQKLINPLSIEKVYVSPCYRALQTVSYALENHPNLSQIVVTVHPGAREIVFNAQDFSLDIEICKRDFNMKSKVKVNWELFENYVKDKKLYIENFHYFENINCFDNKIKNELYERLVKIYNNGDYKEDELRKEIVKISEIREKTKTRPESLKHCFERFLVYKDELLKLHKETLNDTDKKVIVFTHGSIINIATSQKPYISDEIQDIFLKDSADVHNGDIISIYI